MNDQTLGERSIFLQAIEIPSAAERSSYLDAACGDDRRLRSEVEALLQAHEGPIRLLDQAAGGATMLEAAHLEERPGTAIGPYKLIEPIGEGGMGVVYMAEQQQPVRRMVALKLVKPGMDTRQVLARFEAERQALAMMDHPNIARVLDADATDSGRPYFVMELVRGIPITEFCDREALSIPERLELFVLVCRAVQHAHQKGVIHRDLKPSNILVTVIDGVAVPKVIDFGVAKATGPSLTERTLCTGFHQFIGTPLYMSPEQADLAGVDVDTRSDIYSLGVLLYELLTGTTPFDVETLRHAAFDEMRRIIREEEPPRPSTRLSSLGERLTTVSSRRKADPRRLGSSLKGELDWVVMKAMEKDRGRRYESASAFAADVRRYLDDEPIEARQTSVMRRVSRLARRNKIALAITASLLAAGGIGTSFALFAQQGRLRRLELELAVSNARERERAQNWAREFAVPQIESHLSADHLVSAFALAREAERYLPKDPTLAALSDRMTSPAALSSDPAGVRVAIRDWDAKPTEGWLALGHTPLRDERLPVGVIRWRFEKDGYVSREMVADLKEVAREPIRLTTTAETPDGMASIPAGDVELVPGKPLKIGAFWIDRFEVTNRHFQEFVDAGGYEEPRYWTEPFVKDKAVLPRDEAMKAFRDRAGRPGPATWANGRYPSGMEDYPVQGVSWYEAAAYAAFSAKRLPTVAHWMRAACSDQQQYIIPLSNSLRPGPAPVGSYIGVGRFDVRDFVGNVREWCWNAGGAGPQRITMGGAWDEPADMYRTPTANSPFTRLPHLGFRCMKSPEELSAELLARTSRIPRRYELETRATPQQLEAYKLQYLYDRSAPLNAQLVSGTDESETCRHEVVRIDASYGGAQRRSDGAERFDVHVFLPRRARPPYPTLVHFPGSGAVDTPRLERRTPSSSVLECTSGIAGFIERGWAVCWPIYWGTFERRADRTWLAPSIVARDRYVQIAKDLSRSLDYLESRGDIDPDRLAYHGFSWGAMLGPVMTVVDPRFRAAVLLCGGYRSAPHMAEVEPFQFAPFMTLPTFMINGRNDSSFYHDWHQRPMYRDLGAKEKTLVLLDASHHLPDEQTVDLAHRWLTDTFRGDEAKRRKGTPGPKLLAGLGRLKNLSRVFTGPEKVIEAHEIKALASRNGDPGSLHEDEMPDGEAAFTRD